MILYPFIRAARIITCIAILPEDQIAAADCGCYVLRSFFKTFSKKYFFFALFCYFFVICLYFYINNIRVFTPVKLRSYVVRTTCSSKH